MTAYIILSCKVFTALEIVTRFVKRGIIHTQFKTHFSSPSVSYINAPTAHVFNTAEG